MKHSTALSRLLDLHYFGGGSQAAADELHRYLQDPTDKNLKTVFTPNPEQLVYAIHHHDFVQVLHDADILLPDGAGLIWALRWVCGRFLPRATGVDTIQALFATESVKNAITRAMVIGGRELPGARVRKDLVKELEGAEVSSLPVVASSSWEVFWTPAYDDIRRPTAEEEDRVVTLIKELKPRLVLVALGAPYQEKWITSHRAFLEQSGVRIAMAVGGTLDVLTGKVMRSPHWLRRLNLEWLYRLLKEPWRWRRQLRLVEFVAQVIWARLVA